MNIFTKVGEKVIAALEELKVSGDLPHDLELNDVEIQEPRDPSHGDLAANAAMVLAKRAGMKPRDLAEKIAGVQSCRLNPQVSEVYYSDNKLLAFPSMTSQVLGSN